MDLDGYRVAAEQLDEVYYMPEFVTSEQERSLIDQICARRNAWTRLSGRRLQNIGARPGGVVGHDDTPMIPEPMPQFVQPLLNKLKDVFPQPPNHVLVNEYHPGEGIMAHEDGPSYHPLVAIVSLGASVVIRFSPKRKSGDAPDASSSASSSESAVLPAGGACAHVSLLLRPRSLLLFKRAAYTDYLHGIDARTEETLDSTICNRVEAGLSPAESTLVRDGVRYSLTCRRVVKVAGKGVASILRRR